MKTNALSSRVTRNALAGAVVAGLTWISTGTAFAQVDLETADLDDDGEVGFSDILIVFEKFGVRSGEPGYLAGLDLTADGIIDYDDVEAMFPLYYEAGADTSQTTVTGIVYDGFGAPLPNVAVSIGAGGNCTGTTAADGTYRIPIPAGMTGVSEINFDGSTATDPSPNVLSGTFPSIPHKPIFINGGKDNSFRAMSLPERDLNGSITLTGGNSTDNGGNNFTLNQAVSYANPAAAGAAMTVPSGVTVQFPAGETPVFSVMKVDPAFSPAPLPPGGSSNVFVSFQPGGTSIPPTPGETLTVCFDNVDGFLNIYTGGVLDFGHPDQPMLLGVEGGAFVKVVSVLVTDASGVASPEGVAGPKLRADIDLTDGFVFAWYPVIQTPPCPRTTVVGVVKDFDINPLGVPVPFARVSVPGGTPVFTNAQGQFVIPNAIAGPNGPRCFTNPFSIRASAAIDLDGNGAAEQGSSEFVAGVPGGITDVGCVPLRGQGTVQGKLLKLTCLDPFTVVPLAGIEITLNSGGIPRTTLTNGGGCYSFGSVAIGAYSVSIHDEGFDFNSCRGDTFLTGTISDVHELDVVDIRLVGTGKTKVTVLDEFGDPVPFAPVDFYSFFDEDLGGGFRSPNDSDFEFTDGNGCLTFLDIPLGNYEIYTSFGGLGDFSELPEEAPLDAAPDAPQTDPLSKTVKDSLFITPPRGINIAPSPKATPAPVPPQRGIEIPGGDASVFNSIACVDQCNNDELQITPPNFDDCDLLGFRIEKVVLNNDPDVIDALKFTLNFLAPLGVGNDEINISLLFDTDLDNNTGITPFSPVHNIEGIEREIGCFITSFGFDSNCFGSEYSAKGAFLGSLDSPYLSIQQGLNPGELCIFVPIDALDGHDLIGVDVVRLYVQVECFGRFESFAVDFWDFDLGGPPSQFSPPINLTTDLPFNAIDPQGDVFFDIFLE